MTRNLLVVCTVVASLATFASAITGSYFAIRAILNIGPGSPRRWIVRVWRLNAVLFADELSVIGRQYRTRYLMAAIATVCAGAIWVTLALALALT